jgi:deoxyribodipyrimidine photo-lyase
MIPATRPEALAALEAFVDGPVRSYARLRNFIVPGHRDVSRLSAAISHRLVGEAEVVRAVLAVHKPATVEKFLQEVAWRSYWKGWLEARPGVWRDFADAPPSANPRASALCAASSGCEAMDAFARELVSTGYLHNHARMWWASFWIHRHNLPWREGARFFLDHLLDADAASNTLSWRWVAGLQTSGKTYLVRRSNLEAYWPDVPLEGLEALSGEPTLVPPPDTADRTVRPLDEYPETPGTEPAVLLVHEEDLSVECALPQSFAPSAVILWRTPPRSAVRAAWMERAIAETRVRLQAAFGQEPQAASDLPSLIRCMESQSVRRIVMAAPCVGPVRDALQPFLGWCATSEIPVTAVRRRWDAQVFPFAKSGFFPFWNAVRPQLEDLCR